MKRTIRTTVLAIGVLIDPAGPKDTGLPADATGRTAHRADN
ncbi:hypothetical protein ACFV06_02290 [Streptomyces sp. NPDC059618]